MARIQTIEALPRFTGIASFGHRLSEHLDNVVHHLSLEMIVALEAKVEAMGLNAEAIDEDDVGADDQMHELADDMTAYIENIVDVEELTWTINRQGVPTNMINSCKL